MWETTKVSVETMPRCAGWLFPGQRGPNMAYTPERVYVCPQLTNNNEGCTSKEQRAATTSWKAGLHGLDWEHSRWTRMLFASFPVGTPYEFFLQLYYSWRSASQKTCDLSSATGSDIVAFFDKIKSSYSPVDSEMLRSLHESFEWWEKRRKWDWKRESETLREVRKVEHKREGERVPRCFCVRARDGDETETIRDRQRGEKGAHEAE